MIELKIPGVKSDSPDHDGGALAAETNTINNASVDNEEGNGHNRIHAQVDVDEVGYNVLHSTKPIKTLTYYPGVWGSIENTARVASQQLGFDTAMVCSAMWESVGTQLSNSYGQAVLSDEKKE